MSLVLTHHVEEQHPNRTPPLSQQRKCCDHFLFSLKHIYLHTKQVCAPSTGWSLPSLHLESRNFLTPGICVKVNNTSLHIFCDCSHSEHANASIIREYGSTLYIGLSRFPHRANTNRFHCNSLASEHFHPKF